MLNSPQLWKYASKSKNCGSMQMNTKQNTPLDHHTVQRGQTINVSCKTILLLLYHTKLDCN